MVLDIDANDVKNQTRAYVRGLRAASRLCFELQAHTPATIASKLRERADQLLKKTDTQESDLTALALAKNELLLLASLLPHESAMLDEDAELLIKKIRTLAYLWTDNDTLPK